MRYNTIDIPKEALDHNLEKVHQARIQQLENELKELQQLKLTIARG